MNPAATSLIARKLLGAYYTPHSAAEYIADWAIRADEERVLEPSFGDGIFLRAVAGSAERKSCNNVKLVGVEIDGAASNRVASELRGQDVEVLHSDFLDVSPFMVDAVIGNPPYVRLRKLAQNQRENAMKVSREVMGEEMDPAGSLWMPFILHSLRFLGEGGRLAFVLPYDFTYVRYARSLWRTLGQNFGFLCVLRTHERLFPEILQDVVILLADDFGGRTTEVHYQAFERLQDLYDRALIVNERIKLDALIRGERSFLEALLSSELRQLIHQRLPSFTCPVRDIFTFNIGYVTGDKNFFHPSRSVIEQYQLPLQSLQKTITSTRMLRKAGLKSSLLREAQIDHLFLPDPSNLTDGELRYIAIGEEVGVSKRYKCEIRDPWYVVPGVKVPDVVLSVFSERPVLLINDGRLVASNSLLCGYRSNNTSEEELAMGWYTSLTLLYCELEVHALGGGVMVMVPREAGNIRVPTGLEVDAEHLYRVSKLLSSGMVEDAYKAGDEKVLVSQLGLSAEDTEIIRNGVEILAHWRTSARSSLTKED